MNNQFEQKNQQSVLNRNNNNPIEQKYQHSILNKNVNNQFEQTSTISSNGYVNIKFEHSFHQSFMNKKMINLNKNLMNLLEQECQFENRYKQAIWTGIWTIIFLKKWTITLNKNMNNQFEQLNGFWIYNMNKYTNNQFGQNYQQLNKKTYKPSIWTEKSTIILNRNIDT